MNENQNPKLAAGAAAAREMTREMRDRYTCPELDKRGQPLPTPTEIAWLRGFLSACVTCGAITWTEANRASEALVPENNDRG